MMQQEGIPKPRFYKVTGMSCAACSSRVEKTVAALHGVDSCSVNLLTGDLIVKGTADSDAVISAVTGIGYGCACRDEGKHTEGLKEAVIEAVIEAKDRTGERIRNQLIISILLLIPLVIISMGAAGFIKNGAADSSYRPVLTACIEFILSTSILLINRGYFIRGVKTVLHKAPSMDTLIALGSGISWIWSVYIFLKMCSLCTGNAVMEILWNQSAELLGQLYFESAAMIPTLITIGKLLEAYSKGKTTDAVNSLKQLRPQKAHLITENGELEISADELRPGDRFSLRPGESVPADGIILEGESLLDESMLSGESRPVEKNAKDPGSPAMRSNRVFTATINRTGFLVCECEKNGNDTVLAQIIRMVTDATATKAPIARFADKAAAYFVPAVMLISTLTFLLWMLAGETVSVSLQRGIAVLVISCPCALGLATPVAIMVAGGVGAKNGILFKTAESLELTGTMKTAVFDKTGTLTTGKPKVSKVLPAKEGGEAQLLKLACSLEAVSEHPLAKAVVSLAQEKGISPDPVTSFQATGSSVSGNCCGAVLTAGSRKIASKAGVSEAELSRFDQEVRERANLGQTPLYFVSDSTLEGILFCEDSLRENAGQSVKELESLGLSTVLLSGDDECTAKNVASKAGIHTSIAGVLPSEKAECIRKLQEKGPVLMAGDGINDAPALTAADIGIAVASGTDVAMDAADVVLMKSDLRDIAAAIRLSRAALKTIRQNLFWAVFYNVLCIPAAAGLLLPFGISVSPMMGAAAMSISSLFVVTNALRLNRLNLYTELKEEKKTMSTTMHIKGMMCPHCEARVKSALESLPDVESAEVSFEKGTATVNGTAAMEQLKKAVTDAGYEVV